MHRDTVRRVIVRIGDFIQLVNSAIYLVEGCFIYEVNIISPCIFLATRKVTELNDRDLVLGFKLMQLDDKINIIGI